MAHIVRLPSWDTAEFPDSMSPDQISSSIQKQFPIKKGYSAGGLLGPLVNKVGHAGGVLAGDIASQIGDVASAIPPTTKQLLHEPGRLVENVASAGVQTAGNIANIPRTIPDALVHYGFIKPETAEKMRPFIPTYGPKLNNIAAGANKVLGLTKEEDKAIQEGLKSLLALTPIGKPLVKGGIGAGKIAGKVAGNAAMMPIDYMRLGPRERALAEANKNVESANLVEQEAKGEAVSTPGVGIANVPSLQRKVSETNQSLQNIDQKLSSLPEETQTVPATPEESKLHLHAAEQAHEEAKGIEQISKEHLEETLGKGKEHNVHLAVGTDKILDSRRKELSKEYDSITNEASQKNITVSNPREIKEIMGDVESLIKENKMHSPEYVKLIKELDNISNPEVVTADKYLSMIKSLKGYSRDARKKAYSHGINEEERNAQMERFNQLDEKIDHMSRILEKGIGPELSERLKAANTGWREEVIPLYKNPIYRKLHYTGQMSEDVIKSLRGKEPGNILIKRAIQSDPSLIKDALGQRYAHKPEAIHEYNELTDEYLNLSPEVKSLVDAHKRAMDISKKAEETVKRSKERQEIVQKEASKREEVKTEKEKLESDRKELKEKLPLLDEHIKKLKSASKQKNITLDEKMKIEKKLDKSRKARSYISTIIGISSGAYVIRAALRMAIKVLKP